MKIQIFDPPMCCSTGVCGPSVDPELVRFAADLDWLRRQGIVVERHNLSQQPAHFVNTPAVKEALAKDGNDCLPLVMVDGTLVCKGYYPNRETLAGFASLGAQSGPSGNSARRLPVVQPHVDGASTCCVASQGETAPSARERGKGGCG